LFGHFFSKKRIGVKAKVYFGRGTEKDDRMDVRELTKEIISDNNKKM
jgi:fructosamine-3-kinase